MPDFPALARDRQPDDGVRHTAVAEISAQLASIWEATLGSAPTSSQANFFLEGGNSLRAMKFMSRVRQRWGTSLKLRELFDHPTISSLSARINDVTTAR